MSKKIIACGGGNIGEEENRFLMPYETQFFDEEIINLSDARRPKILFLGLADTKNIKKYFYYFSNVFSKRYGCLCKCLELSDLHNSQKMKKFIALNVLKLANLMQNVKIQKLLQNGEVNPRDIKMHLARSIVSLYHTEEELKEAEASFQAIYQKKDVNNIELLIINYDSSLVDENEVYSLIDCIFSTEKYKSKSEVRRLIQQSAVKLNGERFEDLAFKPIDGTIIQVGKGNMFRLAQNQEVKKTLIKK